LPVAFLDSFANFLALAMVLIIFPLADVVVFPILDDSSVPFLLPMNPLPFINRIVQVYESPKSVREIIAVDEAVVPTELP